MPPLDRSALRNTFIYASKNRTTVHGGLWATEGVTNANLYSMVEIFCFIGDVFYLHDGSEQLIERDGKQLQPGNYYSVTIGSIIVTDETPVNRMVSLQTQRNLVMVRAHEEKRERELRGKAMARKGTGEMPRETIRMRRERGE